MALRRGPFGIRNAETHGMTNEQTKPTESEKQKDEESKALDEQLKQTFPASDPLAAVTPHKKEEKPKAT